MSVPCNRESTASPLTETMTEPTSGPSSPSAMMATVLVSPSAIERLVVENVTVRLVLAYAPHRDHQISTGGDVAKPAGVPISDIGDEAERDHIVVEAGHVATGLDANRQVGGGGNLTSLEPTIHVSSLPVTSVIPLAKREGDDVVVTSWDRSWS